MGMKNIKMFSKTKNAIIGLLITLYLIIENNARVHKVANNPDFSNSRDGSIYGGTQLYIIADGIDAINFNNEVKVGDYNCNIINYYTTETQLVCIIPIYVRVNNQLLDCHAHICKFNFVQHYSPYVSAIIPNSIVAGDNIKFYGHLIMNNTSQVRDLRIGDYICDTENYYRDLYVWGRDQYFVCDSGDEIKPGYYKFKLRSQTYTGFAKVLNKTKGYTYSNNQQEFDIKIHPKIENFSSNMGYTTGQIIDIVGRGFGDDISKINISLEGFTLNILELKDDNIKLKIN